MARPSPVRDAALVALAERGPMTTPEVARTIRADANAVSTALQRLLRDGLVQVKRGKCTSANYGQPMRGANTWRIKPGTQSDSVVNKNIQGTTPLDQAVATAGDKLRA